MKRAGCVSLMGATAVMLVVLSGCSSLLGKLRQDLNDQHEYYEPTHGGLYPEGGYLSEDVPTGSPYGYVGHSERAPAGMYGPADPSNSWMDSERTAANERDIYRNAVTYSDTDSLRPSVMRQYERPARARRSDFVDESQTDGSLWASDGQTNYFFTKNRIRGVGDIITVTIEDQMIKDIGVELKNSLSQQEVEAEMALAQERIRARALGLPVPGEGKDQVRTGAAAPQRAPAEQGAQVKDEKVEIREATYEDIDVRPQMELQPGETMMAEIIERYPNGNYKIRGTKRVMYRGDYRMVTMLGIAKSADIKDDDLVASGRLYEYRLKVYR